MIEIVRTGMCKDCTYVELTDSPKYFVGNFSEMYVHCEYEKICERAYKLGQRTDLVDRPWPYDGVSEEPK